MKSLILSVALVIAGLPSAATAQTSSPPSGDLQIERKQKKAVVLPKPSAEQVRADADRAIDEYTTGKTPGQVVRETSPVRPSARPDQDNAVRQGLQQQNLNRQLHGR